MKEKTVEGVAVHVAAVIMQADGLCRYNAPVECRRYYPPSDDDCVKCIERWLLAKAKKIMKEAAK